MALATPSAPGPGATDAAPIPPGNPAAPSPTPAQPSPPEVPTSPRLVTLRAGKSDTVSAPTPVLEAPLSTPGTSQSAATAQPRTAPPSSTPQPAPTATLTEVASQRPVPQSLVSPPSSVEGEESGALTQVSNRQAEAATSTPSVRLATQPARASIPVPNQPGIETPAGDFAPPDGGSERTGPFVTPGGARGGLTTPDSTGAPVQLSADGSRAPASAPDSGDSSTTSPAESASNNAGSNSQNHDQGQPQSQSSGTRPATEASTRPATAIGLELPQAIFEMPPDGARVAGAPNFESRLLETMDAWFAEDARGTAAGERAASALGTGRKAVAAAWLGSLRGSSSPLGPSANQWNEIRIELDNDAGVVHIRARRDAADQLTVQVQTSDAQTRAHLNAAANSLEDQLRDRYGADVDLSFGSDTETETDGKSGNGDRRHAPQNIAGRTKTNSPDTPLLRGADRVWVG